MECRLALIRDDFDTRERDRHLWDVAASLLFVAVLMLAMWCRVPVLFIIPPAFVAAYFFRRWGRRRLSDWAGPMDQMGWLILTPVSIRV